MTNTQPVVYIPLHNIVTLNIIINVHFSGNTASEQGANIFGGLLDRCIPSPFAEVYKHTKLHTPPHNSGVSYLGDITNITALGTIISSLPIRVCFCKSESEPDCSYQLPPTFKVKKGEAFTMPLVAVDQVNHSVDANISVHYLHKMVALVKDSKLKVYRKTSNITFNVFSSHSSETINLFADDPCGSSTFST